MEKTYWIIAAIGLATSAAVVVLYILSENKRLAKEEKERQEREAIELDAWEARHRDRLEAEQELRSSFIKRNRERRKSDDCQISGNVHLKNNNNNTSELLGTAVIVNHMMNQDSHNVDHNNQNDSVQESSHEVSNDDHDRYQSNSGHSYSEGHSYSDSPSHSSHSDHGSYDSGSSFDSGSSGGGGLD